MFVRRRLRIGVDTIMGVPPACDRPSYVKRGLEDKEGTPGCPDAQVQQTSFKIRSL